MTALRRARNGDWFARSASLRISAAHREGAWQTTGRALPTIRLRFPRERHAGVSRLGCRGPSRIERLRAKALGQGPALTFAGRTHSPELGIHRSLLSMRKTLARLRRGYCSGRVRRCLPEVPPKGRARRSPTRGRAEDPAERDAIHRVLTGAGTLSASYMNRTGRSVTPQCAPSLTYSKASFLPPPRAEPQGRRGLEPRQSR